MKKSLLSLISICGLYMLSGCGSTPALTQAPPVATHFSVTPATATPSAGTAFNITVTALDASGQMVTSYSGTVSFTSSLGQVVQPSNPTLTNGTGTFPITLSIAGAQTISAFDSMISGTSSPITVGPPGLLTITSGTPPNGYVGVAYDGHNDPSLGWIHGFTLSAKSGVPPYKWSWSTTQVSPIPGLFICANRHTCTQQGIPIIPAIGGTPTTAGTYNVVVTVTDSAIPQAQKSANYTITINPAAAAVASSTPSLSQEPKATHHHYKLVDMGTLGGPNSGFGWPFGRNINSHGTVIAEAETAIGDPLAPNCLQAPDCLINRGLQWKDGVSTDMGSLPGLGSFSFPYWINDRGDSVGQSTNGLLDPLTGYPELRAMLWKDGKIVDLGTLGGNVSTAVAINNRGEIAGGSLNAILDNDSTAFGWLPPFPVATQVRAVLCRDGVMHDLGTLGTGNNAIALFVNNPSQVAGVSLTNTSADSLTGNLTQHPFFWDDGKMVDIGTLGGTSGTPWFMNNMGQVVGDSNLAGDQAFHAFVWDKKSGLKDLGTLPGQTVSFATWINDEGEIVGNGDFFNGGHSILWKNGKMIDIGLLPGDCSSEALVINSKSQIIGNSSPDCSSDGAAVLWENGEAPVNLNTLITPASSIDVRFPVSLNDRGEIAADGVLPNGDVHAVVLIPCDENHSDVEGCDFAPVELVTAAPVRSAQLIQAPAASPASSSLAETINPSQSLRESRKRRYRMPRTSPN
jgi:probable HAF family extracellular repeat protein